MSFLRGTNVEQIAGCAVAGTAISNSASAGVLNAASGSAYLPISFFNGQLYRSLWVRAQGIYSSPASAPATQQIGVTFDTAQNTIGALTILSGAITPAVSMTNALWVLDLDIMVSTMTETSGAGTANVVGIGTLTLHNSTITTAGQVFPVGGTSLVSLGTFTGLFAEIYGKFGTAVAGSSMQCQMSRIYGCN